MDVNKEERKVKNFCKGFFIEIQGCLAAKTWFSINDFFPKKEKKEKKKEKEKEKINRDMKYASNIWIVNFFLFCFIVRWSTLMCCKTCGSSVNMKQ